MKQRLLLALLMVFASVGLAMGQSTIHPINITIPANAGDVTISIAADNSLPAAPSMKDEHDASIDPTGGLNGAPYVYTISESSSERTVYFENGDGDDRWNASSIAMTVSGKVSSFVITSEGGVVARNLSSLVFDANGVLEDLILGSSEDDGAYVPKLKALSCDGNKLKHIPAIGGMDDYVVGTQNPSGLKPIVLTQRDANFNVSISSSVWSDLEAGETAVFSENEHPESFELKYLRDEESQAPGKYTVISEPTSDGVKILITDKNGVIQGGRFYCDLVISEEDDNYPGVTLQGVSIVLPEPKFTLTCESRGGTDIEGNSITVKKDSESGEVVNDQSTFKTGDKVFVEITVADGYYVKSITRENLYNEVHNGTEEGEFTPDKGLYVFTGEGNAKISVEFAEKPQENATIQKVYDANKCDGFSIIDADTDGELDDLISISVPQSIKVKIKPKKGYLKDHITVNNTTYELIDTPDGEGYYITNNAIELTEAITYTVAAFFNQGATVDFVDIPTTVTISVTEPAATNVTEAEAKTYEKSSTLKFTATADSKYELTVTCNGQVLPEADGSYVATLSNAENNIRITVLDKTATISVEPSGESSNVKYYDSTGASSKTTFTMGETIQIRVKAEEGKKTYAWLNGVLLTNSTELTDGSDTYLCYTATLNKYEGANTVKVSRVDVAAEIKLDPVNYPERGDYEVTLDGTDVDPEKSYEEGQVIEIIPTVKGGEYEIDEIRVVTEAEGTIIVEPDASGKYLYSLRKGTNTIQVDFSTIVGNTLEVMYDNSSISDVKVVNTNRGDEYPKTGDISYSDVDDKTSLTLTFKVNSGINPSVVLNGTPYRVTKMSGNEYTLEFEIPEGESILKIDVETRTTIVFDLENAVYDGTAKPVEYTTTPANMNNITVEYYVDGWTTAAPTEAGTYQVRFSRKGDRYYEPVLAENEVHEYTIAQAPLVITQQPTISLNGALNKHIISGGAVGYKQGDSYVTVSGTFEFYNATAEDHRQGCQGVSLKFTPTESDDNLVNNGYINESPVYCDAQINKNNETRTIQLDSESEPFVLTYSDGKGNVVLCDPASSVNVEVKPGVVITPDYDRLAYQLFYIDENGEEQSALDGSTSVAINDWVVNDVITLKLKARERDEIVFKDGYELDPQEYKYDGDRQSFEMSTTTLPIIGKSSNQAPSANEDYKLWEITYYDASGNVIPRPIEIGTYTVKMVRPATKYFQEFSVESQLIITQATLDKNVYRVDKPRASRIAIGQPLYYSELVGATEVAGYYAWADDDRNKIPSDHAQGSEYEVWFYPLDDNYQPLELGSVPVYWTNVPIVTWFTDYKGYVTLEDEKTGEFYYSGDAVPAGTELTVRVYPFEMTDYEVQSIQVKVGDQTSTIANGGKVTFKGKESMEINASFSVITPEVPDPEPSDPEIDPNSQYVVTLPSQYAVRGAIINNPGKNGVKFDDPFTFTISTASADAGKLVVKANGTTLTPSSTGVYQLPSVTSNTNITVSLANPTPLNVSVETTAKNAKGYVMGHVQVDGPSDGVCYYGDKILLAAFPEDGVSFTGWSDDKSVKDRMREIIVKTDMTIKALFSGVPTGIEDIESASILAGDGYILIKNVADANVTIVGMTGRIQAQQQISGDTQIRVPAGIYVVILENGQDVKQVKVIVR